MSGFPGAAVVIGLLHVAALGLGVAGVYELAGMGWALLAGALACGLTAGIIARGLRS